MKPHIDIQPAQISTTDHAASPVEQRVFLLLQGPHGPFFDRLGALLRDAGAEVWRVGFNAGDRHFWSDPANFIAHRGSPDDWPDHLERLIAGKRVTDIVLYGDVRPIHAAARKAAQRHGLVLHVFEEGYLRPYWITYERGGANGHSRLMQLGLRDMRQALRGQHGDLPRPPASWGDMRQHKFYSVLYHFQVLARNSDFPGYRNHRNISGWREFRLNLRRFLLSPYDALARMREARAVLRGGYPYVLVLMQLEHDASFQAHSDYPTMSVFTDEVLHAFAHSAPKHHHLVFKAHPLEDGRAGIREKVMAKAAELGLQNRVHYVRGGKLAGLLAQARSAVTVNSTAAQQALWRGLPVKNTGRAVYEKHGLVSRQSLDEFFDTPIRPNSRSYQTYRDYLLETSQVPGGFYAKRSRAHALRLVIDLILNTEDPYDALAKGGGQYRQQMGDSAD